MVGLEAAVLKVALSVATAGGKALLASKRASADRSSGLGQQALISGLGLLESRRFERQISALADRVFAQLQHRVAVEFVEVANNDKVAAVLAVADTLQKSEIADELLLAADVDEARIRSALLPWINASLENAGLDPNTTELYHLVLREALSYLTEIVVSLPSFQGRGLQELLRRDHEIIDLLGELVDRMPTSADGTGRDAFEKYNLLYRREISRRVDRVDILGVTRGGRSRRYPLSVAYIGLTTQVSTSMHGNNSRENNPQEDVENVVTRNRLTLIRGDAGSGKTTLLRWLALQCASGRGEGDSQFFATLVPFLIELRRYVRSELPSPSDYVKGSVPAHSVEQQPKKWCLNLLENSRALLLVDGVDEFPVHRRREVKNWVADLVEGYPRIRIVVTSRPAAVPSDWLRSEGFLGCELVAMSRPHMQLFINRWHDALELEEGEAGGHRLTTDELRTSLEASLEKNRSLRLLATNPLMCSLICALNWDRSSQLPINRVEIYEAALEMLLLRRDTERGIEDPSGIELGLKEKREILKELAAWFTQNSYVDADSLRATAQIARTLRTLPHAKATPDQALSHLIERSGIIRQPAHGLIDFLHKSFQEYLTAQHFIDDDKIDALMQVVSKESYSEVLVMAAGVARPAEAERLLRSIVQLLQRGGDGLRLRLLLARCVEVVQRLSDEAYSLVITEVQKALPPKNESEARALASVGNVALDSLRGMLDKLEPSHKAVSIYLAALIGGYDALTFIASFNADTANENINRARARAWSYFDPRDYVEHVFNAGSQEWHLETGDTGVLQSATKIRNLASLKLVMTWDGSQSGSIRELRGIAVVTALQISGNPVLTDLHLLRDARSLKKLEILNCRNLRKITDVIRASGLTHLTIKACPSLVTRDVLDDLPDLEYLDLAVLDLPNLKDLDETHPKLVDVTTGKYHGHAPTQAPPEPTPLEDQNDWSSGEY